MLEQTLVFARTSAPLVHADGALGFGYSDSRMYV